MRPSVESYKEVKWKYIVSCFDAFHLFRACNCNCIALSHSHTVTYMSNRYLISLFFDTLQYERNLLARLVSSSIRSKDVPL